MNSGTAAAGIILDEDCNIRLLEPKSYNGNVALEAACAEVLTALHEFKAILSHTLSETRYTANVLQGTKLNLVGLRHVLTTVGPSDQVDEKRT